MFYGHFMVKYETKSSNVTCVKNIGYFYGSYKRLTKIYKQSN